MILRNARCDDKDNLKGDLIPLDDMPKNKVDSPQTRRGFINKYSIPEDRSLMRCYAVSTGE